MQRSQLVTPRDLEARKLPLYNFKRRSPYCSTFMNNFSQKAGAQKGVKRSHQPQCFVLRYGLLYFSQWRCPVSAGLGNAIWEKKPVKFLDEDAFKIPKIMQIFGPVEDALHFSDWPHFVDRSWMSTTCMQWNVAVRRFSVGPVRYTATVKIKV